MMLRKLESAKQYVGENKIIEAVKLLNEIIESNDNEFHRDAFFELGKIYYIQRRYDLAEVNVYHSLNIEKNDKNAMLLLAKILKETGKQWRSIKLFLKLRKVCNNDIEKIKEIDSENILMFSYKEKYISAIKYINKYCNGYYCEEKNRIYKYLLQKITKLNNLNKFKEAKLLSNEALKKLKIDDIKIKNAILNEFEIASNIVELKSFPRSLTVSLTEKCNLKCKMCSQSKMVSNELTKLQVEKLIKLFPYLENILWVGGEVFLYNGFEKLMDLANKYDIKQNITSNGLLISEEYAKKIVDYNVELNLSIDSVNKEVYEFIREGASFDTLLRNIKTIKYYREQKKVNSSLILNAVLSRWNFEVKNNFFDILNFAKENSFDGVNIYMDAFEQDDLIRNKEIKSFNDRLDELVELAKKLQLKLNNFVYYNYKHNVNIQNKKIKEVIIEKEYLNKKGKESIKEFNVNDDLILETEQYCKTNIIPTSVCLNKGCLLPWKKLYVSYGGDILVECHCPKLVILKNEKINYLKNEKIYDDIIKIWNSKELVNVRKEIIENNLQCMTNCYLDEKYKKPIAFR